VAIWAGVRVGKTKAQAAEQRVSSQRSTTAGGTLGTSRVGVGVQKVAASDRVRRTRAMASAKVGAGVAYQAAVRVGPVGAIRSRSVSQATKENKPNRRGVVRWLARDDPWRWVSRPP
jgi:hypothetical protein